MVVLPVRDHECYCELAIVVPAPFVDTVVLQRRLDLAVRPLDPELTLQRTPVGVVGTAAIERHLIESGCFPEHDEVCQWKGSDVEHEDAVVVRAVSVLADLLFGVGNEIDVYVTEGLRCWYGPVDLDPGFLEAG